MVNFNQFLQWWAAPWIQTSGAPRCIFLPSPPPRQHEGAAGQASTRWGRIFESSLNCFLLPVTGAESDKSSILLLRLQKEDGGFIWTHSVLQVTTMLHILPCYIHHDQNPYNNDHQWRFTNSPSLSWFQLRDAVEESATPVIILTNQILSIEEAAVWSSPTPTLSSANHHYPQHFCYYKTNQGHARQLLAVPLLHGSEPPAVRSCLWGSLAGCPLIPLLPSCAGGQLCNHESSCQLIVTVLMKFPPPPQKKKKKKKKLCNGFFRGAQKWNLNVQKIRKKTKKKVKIPKEWSWCYVLYDIYIFLDFIINVLIFKKKIWILPNSKKVCETRAPYTYGPTVNNFFSV